MKASFANVSGTPNCEGIRWAVRLEGWDVFNAAGRTVRVQKRNGDEKVVVLGRRLMTANGDKAWYAFDQPAAAGSSARLVESAKAEAAEAPRVSVEPVTTEEVECLIRRMNSAFSCERAETDVSMDEQTEAYTILCRMWAELGDRRGVVPFRR